MNVYCNPKKQQGVTLIELMISITIGLILLAGIAQIFVSNKKSYQLQQATARVQDNGRVAMQILSKEIRMADFWGCANNASDVVDHLDCAGSSHAACVTPPNTGGIKGEDNNADSSDSIVNGTDTLFLQGAFGGDIPVETHSATAASFKTIRANGLKVGQIVLATDCTTVDRLQITNANTSTSTVVSNTGGSTVPGNLTKLGKDYATDAMLFALRAVDYHIEIDSDGMYGLYQSIDGETPQMLVEGVENMQIMYGVDIDNNKSADMYQTATQITTEEADPTPSFTWEEVVAIRLTLTVRSEDGVTADVTAEGDRRVRRTFTSTTTIRNRITI